MPPPPELIHAPGEVGPVEVLRHVHPKEGRSPSDQVRPAGEIGVQLHAVQRGAKQEGRALVLGEVVEQLRHRSRQGVGQERLFQHAPDHQLDGALDLRRIRIVPPEELGLELVVAVDRPLDHLGEPAGEEGVFQKIPLGLHPPPVHVDEVAGGLEDIEGDSQGQQQAQGPEYLGNAEKAEEAVCRPQPGIQVFEEGQGGEIQDQGPGQYHPPPALAPLFDGGAVLGPLVQLRPLPAAEDLHTAGGGEGQRDGRQQVCSRPDAVGQIEERAGGQEDQPAVFFRQQIVGPGGQGQKQQKACAVDGHSTRSSVCVPRSRYRGAISDNIAAKNGAKVLFGAFFMTGGPEDYSSASRWTRA